MTVAVLWAGAATASAASLTVSPSIQGAGTLTATGYTGCANSNQNDAVVAGCPGFASDSGFFGGAVGLTLTATPSATPAGHWRFLGWQGCPTPAGNQCTLASGVFQTLAYAPRAVFDDFVAPTVTLAPETYSGVRSVSFSSTTNETANFQCSLDSLTLGSCAATKSYGPLDEGTHTFRVRATDLSGNVSGVVTRTIRIVDTELTSGPDDSVNTQGSTFAFSTGAGTAFECSVDTPIVWVPCTSPKDVVVTTEGEHVFRVRARDGAYVDPTPAVRTWTVDWDRDLDGGLAPVDCDDSNASIHPGAYDVPGNGVDEDCSGADTPAPPAADSNSTSVTAVPAPSGGSTTAGGGSTTAALTNGTADSTTPSKAVQCVVPKLKGKTLAAAKRALKAGRCALGKVTKKRSRGKSGRVLAQSRKAGTKRLAGSKIALVLSKR